MKPAIAIFLCGFCLSAFVRSDAPETVDELLPLYAAVSLLDHGDVDIPIRDTYHPDFYVASQNGRYYPKFGPGQALMLAPFAAAGRLFCGTGDSPEERGRMILQAALFFGSLVVPLIGVMAFRFWVHLGYSTRAAALSAILLMSTSELLPYSRSLFGDLSCALMSFAALCSLGGLKETSRIRPAIAGLCLGFSVLIRPVTFLFLAPFALYLVLVWKRQSISPSSRRRQLLAAVVPFAMECVLLLVFNRHAYGSVFSTGYQSEMFMFDQSLIAGVPHILFSPEKGFFVYSPAVLFSILFWIRFHRRHSPESITAVLFSILHVYIYASWYANSPGNELSYGQRFLLPVVPMAYLALPECVSGIKRNLAGILCVPAFHLSFLAQMTGCLQRGESYRTWASQFLDPPSPLAGYLLKSIQDPSSVVLWWWQRGGWAVGIGVGLACVSVYLGVRVFLDSSAEST